MRLPLAHHWNSVHVSLAVLWYSCDDFDPNPFFATWFLPFLI